MSRWTQLRLGDVITLKRGYDLPKRDRREGEVPIISSSGPTGYHREARAEPPGVVTGRYGTLGKVYYLSVPYWPLNTTLYVKDFKQNHERFVAYVLETMRLERYDGASAVPGLDRNVLHRLNVRWPSHDIQRKIAAVLAAYDELIASNLRRIEILAEMAQAVYREWFVNFRFPSHEDVPLVDSPLGPIPEGWRAGTFGDVARNSRSLLDPARAPDEDFAHFSFAAFDDGQVPTVEAGASMKSGKLLVEGPSVLLAKLNPRIARVWLAEPDRARRSVASSEFLVFTGAEGIPLDYVCAICMEPQFQAGLARMSGGTSTSHQRLKLDDLLARPLPVPPPEQVRAFGELVGPMNRLAASLVRQNTNLRSTRDLLLPRLVSGEIDVADLDIETDWLAS